MPQTLFTLANPKPAHPACPILRSEATVKALAYSFPFSFCLLTNPCASPSGPAWCAVFSQGNCE